MKDPQKQLRNRKIKVLIMSVMASIVLYVILKVSIAAITNPNYTFDDIRHIFTYETAVIAEQEEHVILEPLYEVYKNGVRVDVPTEWQHHVRRRCEEYGFDEKILISLITTESTWNAEAINDGGFIGLGQISTFWVGNSVLNAFNYYVSEWDKTNKFAWLQDPYNNIDVIIATWRYARDAYYLDLSSDKDYYYLLQWYNSGQYIENGPNAYSKTVMKFRDELVAL